MLEDLGRNSDGAVSLFLLLQQRLLSSNTHRDTVGRNREMESSAGGEKEEAGLYNSAITKTARLRSTLSALLDDPILADVPKNPSFSDVDTLVNLELGSAMRISVLKLDNTSFDVVVLNSAKVKDLKMAVRRRIDEMEQSKMGHRHISWKRIWANFCLSHHNEKLLDDESALQDFRIRNSSQVHFVPHIMPRGLQRHSRRRKHRFFHGLNKRA